MLPPPRAVLPVINILKETYTLWITYFIHLPNLHKYTLGEKISNLFLEAIEMTVYASFLAKNEKLPYIKIAVRKVDTLKIFFQIAWEIKVLDDKKYLQISEKLDAVGKMLGGWHNNLLKENSPSKS